MKFGEELTKLRKAKGFTIQQLAEMVGMSRTFLGEIESGVKLRLGADVLFDLCDALGVKCDHFRECFRDPVINPPSEPTLSTAAKPPRRKSK